MTDTKTAIFAGGCFWGVEDLFRKLPGVVATEVGYTGGRTKNATYKDVKTGTTGHAEAIRISYDPARISYRKLLEFLFQIHDPTTKDRQGNDIGSQYRSAIFALDDEQKREAEAVIAAVNASGKWPGKVVTTVEPAGEWWKAEEYHQDYLVKYPDGYTCHFIRPSWKL
ncbi:MAG: peptide-methionine (S)-S-oxide reductase MsrA [Parvularculaceae bacterium]